MIASRLILLLAGLVTTTAGCESYRVEYRTRPQYYDRLVEEPIPDREVLPDGTTVVYRTVDLPAAMGARGEDTRTPTGEPFRMWHEQEDGSIVLTAFMPEHVIGNTLNCLRLERYDLLWEQVLSERTRARYRAQGQGEEEFTAFFEEHRLHLARMLNRMRLGLATHEVVVTGRPDGIIECRFWPQVAKLFDFKRLLIVRESWQLRLLMIE